MYLGLDLRGGVHSLLQVDMKQAVDKRIDGTVGDVRSVLRDKGVRHGNITRMGKAVEVRFRDAETRDKARHPRRQLARPGRAADAGDAGELKPGRRHAQAPVRTRGPRRRDQAEHDDPARPGQRGWAWPSR
jgi:preprotein translocase subunit SecD